jgi:hypothetical protein
MTAKGGWGGDGAVIVTINQSSPALAENDNGEFYGV